MRWGGVAASVLVTACVPHLTGAPCRADNNCPVNQYCDGTNCQSGPPPANRVVQLLVSTPTGILPLGSTVQATATAVLQSGAQEDVTAAAAWSSTDSRVAQVSNDAGSVGLVLAVATGEVGVDATLGSNSGSAHLIVTDAQLVFLVVTVDRPVVAARSDVLCTATGFFTDGTHADLTSLASWTSSQPQVVFVSTTPGSIGALEPLSAGTAEVTARYQRLTGSTAVTVTDATLVGLSIAPLLPWVSTNTNAQLQATGLFSDGTAQPMTGSVQWTVDDPSLAFFLPSVSGEVQGFAPGATLVDAQAGTVTAEAPLVVSAAPLASLEVSPALPDPLGIGGVAGFTAFGAFSDEGVLELTTQAIWSSTKPDVLAVVPGSGQASALDAGAVDVQATFGGFVATAPLAVDAATPNALLVWPPSSLLTVGLPGSLVAERVLSDGAVDDVTPLVGWNSSCPAQLEVATGVRGGALVARAAKTCVAGAKLAGAYATATVDAIARAVQRLEVSPAQVGIGPGGWVGLSATAIFSDGTLLDVTSLAGWSSSAVGVVLAGNGLQAGQALAADAGAGVSQLTASFGGATASSSVNVGALAPAFEVWPPFAQLHAGTALALRATTVWPAGDAVDVTPWTVFFSSNTTVAGVANAAGGRGILSGAGPGTAAVIARFGPATASTSVAVDTATPVALAIVPPSALPAGEPASFHATAQYSDGSAVDVTGKSAWTSSAPSVLRLRGTGPPRGAAVPLGVGSAEARALFEGVSGSTSVDTTPGGLLSLSIQTSASSAPAGSRVQLAANASYPNGVQLDVTSRAVWTSLSPTVASISNGPQAGLLTAQTPGPVVVTAMFEGTAANLSFAVTSATLTQLTILPVALSGPVGVAVALQAQGTFSDGSRLDLTQQARWSSANPALVAVSNAPDSRGNAMALTPGTSTLSASVTRPDTSVVTGSASFVGGAAVVVGVDIIPAHVALSLSGTASVTLRATAQLSDGTTRDVSAEVTWSVQGTAIAEVTASGALTGLKTGDTTVFATLAGLVGSAPVTVGP